MKDNKGFALSTVIIIFAVVVIFSSSMFFITITDARSSRIRIDRIQLSHSAISVAECIADALEEELRNSTYNGIENIDIPITLNGFTDEDIIQETFMISLEINDDSFVLTVTASCKKLSYSHKTERKLIFEEDSL